LEYYIKSLRISEQLQDIEKIGLALFKVSNTYKLQENSEMVLPYFFQAAQLFKITNTPNLVNIYNLMGIVYDKKENRPRS